MKLILVSKKINNLDKSEILPELEKEFGSDKSYILISPEDKSYKIDEIKKFIRSSSFRKNETNENVVHVLLSGDSLTPIVQNALLKTLEESDLSIIILIKNPDSLLPTIRSRMQIREIKSEEIKNKSNEFSIDFDSIPSIAKLERSEVVKRLESLIENIDLSEIKNSIYFQESIDKINANCKVEAVLIELVQKTNS